MFVFKAGVVGAGGMGGEIAQVIAAAGIPVVLKDVDQKFVDAGLTKAREVTEGQAAKLVEKGKLSEEDAAAQAKRTLGLITGTTSYDEFADVDFVIEAVPEKMEIKHAVFAELDAATPGHAILASNTSGLSITEIGDATLRPEKVCGFHFFWPASVLPLVEIVEGDDTAPETIGVAVNFAQSIRKQPITCSEVPGFVVNRILIPLLNDCVRALDEARVTPEEMDTALRNGAGWPMGPCALIDLVGIDVHVHASEALYEKLRQPRMAPPPRLVAMRNAGLLGRKSGRGFYVYDA